MKVPKKLLKHLTDLKRNPHKKAKVPQERSHPLEKGITSQKVKVEGLTDLISSLCSMTTTSCSKNQPLTDLYFELDKSSKGQIKIFQQAISLI